MESAKESSTIPVDLDLPPEYCHYRDEGCELATAYLGHQSRCYQCPFPNCIYEEPRGRQRWAKRLRDREIVRQLTTESKGTKEVAAMLGISQRTVQRVLKRARNESTPKIKIFGGPNE